jgi:hypothetical protein
MLSTTASEFLNQKHSFVIIVAWLLKQRQLDWMRQSYDDILLVFVLANLEKRNASYGTVKELYHYTISPPMHSRIQTTPYSGSVRGTEGFLIAECSNTPSASSAAPDVKRSGNGLMGTAERHPRQPKLSNKVYTRPIKQSTLRQCANVPVKTAAAASFS